MNELALAIPYLGKRNPAAARWVVLAIAFGAPLIAMLCGKTWVPTRDPGRYQVCPTCQEVLEAARAAYGSGGSDGEH